VVFLGCALLLAGCGLSARQQEAERVAAITQQAKTMNEACGTTYTELPKDAIARAQCYNDADKVYRQIARYPDLIDLRIAKRMEVAERIASQKITRAQGMLELSQLQTSLVDEEQKRNLSDRSVRAQELAAVAAASPTTCTKLGATVTCF
jgi:hypothetical protein